MQRLRDVSLRQLRIFASAARTLNFAKTSEELHLTQPAISMQIKQLDELVGLPLFERNGKRVALTHAGEELRDCAIRMLDLLRVSEERIAALHGLKGGRVNIGIVSTAKYFAPKLLGMFKRAYEGIEVRLALHNRASILEALRLNAIDIAIMGQPPAEMEVVASELGDHPSVIIAPVGHLLTTRSHIPVKELANERFLVRELGSGTRSSMDRFFAKHGIEPKVEFEMTSNESLKQAVMAGMGLAFISLHTIGLECETGNLAILDVDGLPLVRRWMVVHLKDKRLSPAAEAFRAFLLSEARGYLESHFPMSAIGGAAAASFIRTAFVRDVK